MDSDVNLGEVYRLVQAVRLEHGAKLEAIVEQTTLTNGKVISHSGWLEVHGREIHELQANHSRVVWTVLGLICTVIAGVVIAVVTRT